MNALQVALAVMLGVWAGYRLATWLIRRTLPRLVNEAAAQRDVQVSAELTKMLVQATANGVANKLLRKWALCGRADIMLAGTSITLVCHDKALLQRAVAAIALRRALLQEDMMEARSLAAPKPAKFEVIEGGVK